MIEVSRGGPARLLPERLEAVAIVSTCSVCIRREGDRVTLDHCCRHPDLRALLTTAELMDVYQSSKKIDLFRIGYSTF